MNYNDTRFGESSFQELSHYLVGTKWTKVSCPMSEINRLKV